jgi:hypothetical protein
MRATLRQLLITGVPAVAGRVFEPHAASIKTEKPFLVVREGVQDAGDPWAGVSTVVEIWPYAARESFVTIDALAAAVIGCLHRRRFAEGADQYLADYLGSAGQDYYDEEWGAITRGLRFRVYALGWLGGLTYQPDPVAALRSWASNTWPELHTDPAIWAPDDAAPGLYWRLVGIAPSQMLSWGAWLDVTIRGHLVAPSAAVRLTYLRRVVEGAVTERQWILSDGSPLLLQAIAADSEADPMRTGQLKLSARMGILAPAAMLPLVTRAVIGGAVQLEVT